MTNTWEESEIDDLIKEYDKYEEEVRTMFTEFLAFDSDHSCTLDKKELATFFSEQGFFEHMSPAQRKTFVTEHINADDANHDGVIDFTEFVHLHNKLVKYKKDNEIPPSHRGSLRAQLHDKVQNAAKAKEKHHQQILHKKQMRENKLKNDFQDHLSREKCCRALKEAFFNADTERTGKVPLETFLEEMVKLGYVSDHLQSHTFEDFTKSHPVMADLTFDMVMQIMFPDLSTSQRKDMAARVKLPPKGNNKDMMEYMTDQERSERTKKNILLENRVELTDDQKRDMCWLFKNWDTDASGSISLDEFVKMMADVHTEEECAALFKEIDLDDSNTLDVWEFVAWWTSSSAQGLDHASAFSQHLLGFIAEKDDPKHVAELI